MEEYREIKGFEGLYEVSNYGNVRSLKRNKILKQINIKGGYKRVSLYKYGEQYFKAIHRLVAEAFIPNPDNLPCVNHKDENPSNNNVKNLEWCDYKYNINYGTANERRSAKRMGMKFSEEHRRKLSESHKKWVSIPPC